MGKEILTQKFTTYICNVCPVEDNTGDPCILNAGDTDIAPSRCPYDGNADSKWKVAE